MYPDVGLGIPMMRTKSKACIFRVLSTPRHDSFPPLENSAMMGMVRWVPLSGPRWHLNLHVAHNGLYDQNGTCGRFECSSARNAFKPRPGAAAAVLSSSDRTDQKF